MGSCALRKHPLHDKSTRTSLDLIAFTKTWTMLEAQVGDNVRRNDRQQRPMRDFPQETEPDAFLQISGFLTPHPQTELEEKCELRSGHFPASQWSYAYSCRKGLKPGYANQDDFAVLMTEDVMALGVFDGHGEWGHRIANFAQRRLMKEMVGISLSNDEVLRERATNAFISCDVEVSEISTGDPAFNCTLSGTTATVLLCSKQKFAVAHVGDSRAVLGRRTPSGSILPIELTKPHKPEVEEERQRIEAKGGAVRAIMSDPTPRLCLKSRDFPGLAMSRSIGDSLAKDIGAVPTPDVYVSELTAEDRFIVLCSDGVWDYISDSEVIAIISQYGAPDCAEQLTRLAWVRWVSLELGYVDDLTALVGFVQ